MQTASAFVLFFSFCRNHLFPPRPYIITLYGKNQKAKALTGDWGMISQV